ncbi:hypothetical protein BB560_003664 [Smittium megazygosporum]|uniref:Arginase n=1 Tax=Smittium megazygosporum TaxID=133381 RepID=A0A2T9ZBG4_9FUNG|nr:hypothetical protein BB560_003664 [Smittium megazygosporum]
MFADIENNKFIKKPSTVSIISFPFNGGQSHPGVELGPKELIGLGLVDQLKEMGYGIAETSGVVDTESLKPTVVAKGLNTNNTEWVSAACKELSSRVEAECRKGFLPVTLGGDHSLAIGTLNGSLKVFGDKLRVLWVDAHADINPLNETASGNLHGCPLALVCGIDKSPFFDWIKEHLGFDKLVYIGLRDVDLPEQKVIKKHNIKAFTMYHIDKYGISKVFDMAMDYINPNRDLPVHMSFDVDSMDPSVIPATGTPVRGGMTFREGHFLCEAMAETGCLVAMDLAEVNPLLGDKEAQFKTIDIGCSLVRSALGETLL